MSACRWLHSISLRCKSKGCVRAGPLVSRTRPRKPSMPWTAPLVNSSLVDPEVAVAEVDQAVVAAPTIGVDDGARVHPAAENAGLALSSPGRSRTWRCRRRRSGAASAPALPCGAFVDLDDQRALDLAGKPQGAVEPVHGVAGRSGSPPGELGGEVADDLAGPGLGNPRTLCVLVFITMPYATYRDTQLGMTLRKLRERLSGSHLHSCPNLRSTGRFAVASSRRGCRGFGGGTRAGGAECRRFAATVARGGGGVPADPRKRFANAW